jgi:hypothetical protein
MLVAFGFCLESPLMGWALKKTWRTKASGSVSLAWLIGLLVSDGENAREEDDSRDNVRLLCKGVGALGEYG